MQTRYSRSPHLAVLLLAIALVAFAAPASARTHRHAAKPAAAPAVAQTSAPVVAGLRAFIDPETGKLGGPITDLQVPGDLRSAPAADPVPVTMPDGSVMLDVSGLMQDFFTISVDPLGRRTFDCTTDPRTQLAPKGQFLLAPAKTPAATTSHTPLLPYAER